MPLLLALCFAATITAAHAATFPDKRMTPGAVDAKLTKEVICAKDFRTSAVRRVSAATKRRVYAAYRMSPSRKPCACEIDHLIPLELGGSNAVENLWPQPYGEHPWNARVKDRLENRLHRLVCSGVISLQQAQREIATDWTKAYKRWLMHKH